MPKPTRIGYSENTIHQTNGRSTLRYCATYMNLRDSYQPQIKTPFQRLFICPVAPCGISVCFSPPAYPVALEGLRRYGNDTAKLQYLFKMAKFFFCQRQRHSTKWQSAWQFHSLLARFSGYSFCADGKSIVLLCAGGMPAVHFFRWGNRWPFLCRRDTGGPASINMMVGMGIFCFFPPLVTSYHSKG